MKKIIVSFLIVVMSVTTYSTTAQALMALPDDYGTGTNTQFCPKLTTTLMKGSRDANTNGEVTELQMFLADQYDLSDTFPSGFFGAQTHKYVLKFQKNYGLPAFGIVGSLTRAKIKEVCSGVAVVGGDRDVHGCIGSAGYTWCTTLNKCVRSWEEKCPAVVIDTNPALDPQCKVWYDGCNTCSRTTPGSEGMCTMMACIQGFPMGQAPKPYCKEYFTASTNRPPVLSGFSGPTQIAVNEVGTWKVEAKDPEGGQLTYAIVWGDENVAVTPTQTLSMERLVQTTTFTHTYAVAGTYTVTITVRDTAGQVARTSSTVAVKGENVACTREYVPVCAQPQVYRCEPNMRCAAGMYIPPKTYANKCLMKVDGATFIHEGTCENQINPTPVACTTEYVPVCGTPKYCTTTKYMLGGYPQECTSGKTYGNKCSLTAEGATYKYGGECQTQVTPPVTPPVACTMEYAPVCGTPKYCMTTKYMLGAYPRECEIGKTFGNKCTLAAEGATYKYVGECK